MKHLYIALIVFLFLSGCNSNEKKSQIPDAGVISYIIEYPDEITNSPSRTLMPKEMNLSFRDQQLKINLNGSFNIFSLNFISLSPNDSCVTIFRFVNNNLTSTAPNSKLIFFYDRNDKPTITYINNQTKVIAGFNCKKALIKFKDFEPFYVYYTTEINLQNPNRNSPLLEIPGVLMEFYVDFNNVRFHFTANNFDYSCPSRSEFKVSKDAKQSSQKEIEALITTLINNFH